MLYSTAQSFAYQQTLVAFAGAVCLFGTWIGMRHFARARATEGATRPRLAVHGFRRHRRGAVGFDLHLDLWRSIPCWPADSSRSPPALVLVIAVISLLYRFESAAGIYPRAGNRRPCDGRRHPCHASRRVQAWHIQGSFEWNAYGLA